LFDTSSMGLPSSEGKVTNAIWTPVARSIWPQ